MCLLIGGLIGGAFSMGGTALTNRAARKEAARNREFQKEMSNTAYRRAMKDMRKAGLNPILAYQKGGASTPSGSMAPVADFQKGVGAGIEGALAGATFKKTNTAAEVDRANTEKLGQDTITSAAQAAKLAKETAILDTQMPRAKVASTFDREVLSPVLSAVTGFSAKNFQKNMKRDMQRFKEFMFKDKSKARLPKNGLRKQYKSGGSGK